MSGISHNPASIARIEATKIDEYDGSGHSCGILLTKCKADLSCGFLPALDELEWRGLTERLMRLPAGAHALFVCVESEQLGSR